MQFYSFIGFIFYGILSTITYSMSDLHIELINLRVGLQDIENRITGNIDLPDDNST